MKMKKKMTNEQKIEWNKLKDIMYNADKIEFEDDEESLQYWSELSELVTLSYDESTR